MDRLSVDQFYGSEYCFSTLMNWQERDGMTIASFEDFAAVYSAAEKAYYYFGSGDKRKLLAALKEDARKRGQALRLFALPEQEKTRLEELFPGEFAFEESRENFDYCYSWETLAHLKGRKLANKRNHINKFMASAPDWVYEPLTEAEVPACKVMAEQWYEDRLIATGEDIGAEKTALFLALDHFREERLIGGVLRVHGKVEAFTLGYPLGERAIVVHFEKANPTLPGSYQMINQQFVRNSCKSFSIINREEDMGKESLRQSKLSYEPVELFVKYTATCLNER